MNQVGMESVAVRGVEVLEPSMEPSPPDLGPAQALEIARMRASAEQAVVLLKVLANEDRLLLLCQIAQGECNVSELEARLGVHQPTLSQQLGVLRREGLVETRREGKQIYYRVVSASALAVIHTLYGLFCQTGDQP